MRKLLLISMLLLISSCNSFPLLKPIERCGLYLTEIDTDIYEGHCRCHEYQISFKNLGRTSESVNHPLSYCNKGVVFNTQKHDNEKSAYYKLNVWFKELMTFGKKYERKKKKR